MTLSLQGKPRQRQLLLVAAAVLATAIAALAALTLMRAGAADPPQPTYAPATVDGNSIEWEQGDLFAPVFPEGDAAGSPVGSIYARYDCTAETLFVLFLTVAGYTIDTEAGAGQLTLEGEILAGPGDPPDGTPPDFALVNLGDIAVGWEASAAVAPGSYSALGVQAALATGIVSVANNAIALVIDCDGSGAEPTDEPAEEPTAEEPAGEEPTEPGEASAEEQSEEPTPTATGEPGATEDPGSAEDPGVGAQQEQGAQPTATQEGSPGAPSAGTGLTGGRDFAPLLIVLGGWLLVAAGFAAEAMRRRLEARRI